MRTIVVVEDQPVLASANVPSLEAKDSRSRDVLDCALFSEQQEGLKAGATAYLVKPEDLFNVGQIAGKLLRSQSARPRIQGA